MQHKRGILVCIFMSAAILALTLSAYATNGDNSVNMKSVSSPIYRLVLPAGNDVKSGFKFTIDPYGMTTIGDSGSTLDKLLENPPGLVTSEAITIQNKSASDVAVTITATLTLPSGKDIHLAKSENEARIGIADLYLKMSPINLSGTDEPIPDIVFSESGREEKKEFNLKGTQNGSSSSAYSFVIDGYANPNSEVWADVTSEEIGIKIVYGLYPSDKNETTTESSSESTKDPASETTTKDPAPETTPKDPTDETTTKDPTAETTTAPIEIKDDVEYNTDDKGFALGISKADVSAAPTRVSVVYKNKPYDLALFGLVNIESVGDAYLISVTNYTMEPGTYDLIVYSGNTVIYDKAKLHIPG